MGPLYCITSSRDMEMLCSDLGVLADTCDSPTSIFSTSSGSNFVGDSPTVEPDREVPSDMSGLEWKEEMEEEVSSVMEGMKGVLSWLSWLLEWEGRGPAPPGEKTSEEPLVETGSIDLWIPCRFFRCLVRSPVRPVLPSQLRRM